MKKFLRQIFLGLVMITFMFSIANAGNIDATKKWAWGDQIGWINFSPSNGGVTVNSTNITGFVWSTNYGWINLSPTNSGINISNNISNGKCISTLSGNAWSSNLGWIDFSGVTIDETGKFNGNASGNNSGNIYFSGSTFGVTTSLLPDCSQDTDGDGISDSQEISDGTNPNDKTSFKDTDGDGVPDVVEQNQGTNPNDANSNKDTDGDGVPDYVEGQEGTDSNDINSKKDTDGDGLSDYSENQNGTDPNNPDVTAPVTIPNTLTGSITDTTATITWETSEPTSGEIIYGLTTVTSQTTGEQDVAPRITSHSFNLTGLQTCTKYYYKTISRDSAGNKTIDGIYNIKTTGCAGGSKILETQDFNIILTSSGAIGSNKLSMGTASNLLEIEVPVGYLNSGTGTCAGTGAYFQLKEIEKNPVILNLGTPIVQKNVLKTYEFSAYCNTTERVTSFNENLTVSMKYSNADINGIKESSLLIYRYNTNNSKWEVLESCSVDIANNTVTCETSSFSTFGIFGETLSTQKVWSGGSSRKDICPNNIDNSGSKYDSKCEKTPKEQEIFKDEEEKLSEIPEEKIVNKEKNKIYKTKTINGKEKKYSIGNSYSSCETIPKIVDLNNFLNKSSLEKLPTKFLDISNSKYKNEIIALEKAGIISGTSETTFEPNRGATRAEYLAIVMKSHCYKYDLGNKGLPFYDVDENSWQAPVIKKALSLKIISGDVDKNGERVFRPNDEISKAEALGILLNMSKFNIEGEVPSLKYTDIKVSWQVTLVKKLEYLGIEISDLQDTNFNPNSKLNRDVLLNFLLKTLELYK